MRTIQFTDTLRATMSSWVYIAICCAVLVAKVQGTYDDGNDDSYEYAEPPCSECGYTSSSTAEANAVAAATATSTGTTSTATASATSAATSESETTAEPPCSECGYTSSSTAEANAVAAATATSTGTTSTATASATSAATSESETTAEPPCSECGYTSSSTAEANAVAAATATSTGTTSTATASATSAATSESETTAEPPCSECGYTSSSTAEANAVAAATATSTGTTSTATAVATSAATSETTDEECLRCGKNEVEACVKSCPPERTCRNRFIMYSCINDPRPCTKKCICAKGYYRNSIGECITAAQCDQCKKPNEFYSCGSECDNECDKILTQNRTNCPKINKKCNEMCYCDDGYARDGDGNCIPVDQCKQCGLNEEQRCVPSCPPERTCRNRNIQYKCQGNLPCTTKCVCKKGYFRNVNGQCITEAQCDKCKKPNEFYDCGGECDNECININSQNRTHCPKVNIKCNEKCYCEDGYARDADGNCIPVEKCKQCGLNEEQRCVPSCPPERTCRNRNIQYKCQGNLPCTSKCVCKKGYFRNVNGQCITEAQCDKCKKPNEFYDCGGECDNECININSQNRTHCPKVNIKCNEKCYCEDGYARDADGNCIPVEKCKRCGLNEEQRCVPSCPPERTCRNRNIQYKCQGNLPCTTKCVCKKGYYRNSIGECITGQQCDQCNKTHEFYSCGSACDNECINIDSQNRINCPIINIKCNEKCYCDDGFARDGNGQCVPADLCKKCSCKQNEVYVQEKRTCPPETCISIVSKYDCSKAPPPKPGCACQPGYLRLKATSPCIPICKCPQMANSPECQNKTCGLNEEYVEKKRTCPPEICRSIVSKYDCSKAPCPKPGCACKSGYLRHNETSPCMPICKCPEIANSLECQNKTCGLNEEYVEKKRTCPPEICSSIVSKYDCSKAPPPKPGCACKSGYLRYNETSPCMPICKCPEIANSLECQNKTCGPNEVVQCVKRCPPEKTCRNRNLAVRCAYDKRPCTKKCVCEKGYYRNALGQCITKAQCDKCKKPNEFYACDSACDNECINIASQSRTNCPIKNIKCNEKCYCDDGYARDGDGNCIPVDQCKRCGLNEEQRCVPSCPPERTCRNRNILYKCQGNLPCTTKCVCKKGYYRNSIGECITGQQCDQCNKTHEFYSCGSACDNECINIDSQNRINCPIINIKCNEKCYCDDGFARDGNGQCVPADLCKKCSCKQNEVYVQEKRTCPPETCISIVSKYDCSKAPPPKPGCACQPGYLRLKATSPCIPICKCPQMANSPECQNKTCGLNEEYVEKKRTCPPEICRSIVSKYDCSKAPCPKPGCACKSGYLRHNETSPCMPICKCPEIANSLECQNKTCGLNEEYVEKKRTCPPEICSSIVSKYDCSKAPPPKPGCACKSGYLRYNETSPCMPICKCPEIANSLECQNKTCGPNEVVQCVKRCPPEKTCRNRNLAVRCAYDKRPCTKKCVCEKGYYRNALGQCITKAQCDKCKKPNEFYACDSACDNECINIASQSRTNCPIKNIKCNEKCYCDDGYARDGDGNCIPVDQCKRCGLNEEQRCVPSCPPERTCRNRNILYKCQGNLPCTTKCVCKKGYYRNSIGECITGQQCDQCNKTHEFYSCGSACDNECINIDSQNRINCPIINIKCNEKCYCDDGFARDGNGLCVPADLCKKCSCKQNEVYVQEKRTCPPETCISIVSKYDCSKAPPPKPGCACQPGYLRLKATSPCIPICKCPQMANSPECQNKTCGLNEEYVEKKRTCPPEICRSIVSKYDCSKAPCPKPGCACKSGYLRHNETSPCMPICKCPEIANSLECQNKTCGLNEEYVEKKRTCPPEICSSIVSKYDCSKAPPPKPGCACKSGYLRYNETSPCMPICKCPQMAYSPECQNKTCGLNEEYVEEKRTCPPETCISMVSRYDCSKAPPPKPGCACKSGYLRRNETSPCIPICQCSEMASSSECQKENCKDPNEEFVQEKITCPPDTCKALTAKYDCSKEPPPQPGCTCKSGYRRLNDICVPICKCPEMAYSPECQNKTCGLNEEYVEKKRTCPPETCVSMVADYDCRKAPPPKPGCACKSGYLRRNETSPCIPSCQCPEISSTPECQKENCKDPNEKFVQEKIMCPPDTCDALTARWDCSKEPPPQPGCTCKSGYRRLNDKCVPICECPQMIHSQECQKKTCKDPNEVYVQEKSTCPGDTCNALVVKKDCSNAPKPQPGCECKDGYRRLNDKCVPLCECPEMASSPQCQTSCSCENDYYYD